jgi:hypothetical protein
MTEISEKRENKSRDLLRLAQTPDTKRFHQAARKALLAHLDELERKAAALDKLEALLRRQSAKELGALLSHYRDEYTEWFAMAGLAAFPTLLRAIEAMPEEKQND